eukprot:GEMP01006926.1.p1 GENE.GEMP01006926.1~~GEMP01006926.1.p1  ORF type:complete len:623 (+),score=119.50 GEMP01006926.1:39-1871(+)
MAPDNAMDKISSPEEKSCRTLADANPQLLEMLSFLKRQAECARNIRDVTHRNKVSEQQRVEMLELVESLRERAHKAQKKVARVETVRRILAKEQREGEDIEAFARRMAAERLGCPKDLSPQDILLACDDENYQRFAPPSMVRRPRRRLEMKPADICTDNAEWSRPDQDPAEVVTAFLESLEFCPYITGQSGSSVTLCMSEYRSRLTHIVRTHIEKFQELMEKDTCSRARSRSNSSGASSDVSRHGSMVLTTQVGLSPGGTEKNIPFCRRLESPNIRLLSSNSPVKTVISILGNSPPSRQRNLSRSRSPEVVRTPTASPQPMAPTRLTEPKDTTEKTKNTKVLQPPRFAVRPFAALKTVQSPLLRLTLPSNKANPRTVVRFTSLAAPRASGEASLRNLALPAPTSIQLSVSSARPEIARFHSAVDTGRGTVRMDTVTPNGAPAIRSIISCPLLPQSRATHANAQPHHNDISPWSLRKQCSMTALETRPEKGSILHRPISLAQFSSSSAHSSAKNDAPSCENSHFPTAGNPSCENSHFPTAGKPSCEKKHFPAPGKLIESRIMPTMVEARRTDIVREGRFSLGLLSNGFTLKNCRIGIPPLFPVAPFFAPQK